MWLLRSSPLDIRTLFLAKYWVGTILLLLVAFPLIVVTNIILQASPLILGITTVSMVGVTFAITALALGLGAIYPNFETENMAEIPTSFGGLVFMMSAVSYLAVVVILLAWPVNGLLQARLRRPERRGRGHTVSVGCGGRTVDHAGVCGGPASGGDTEGQGPLASVARRPSSRDCCVALACPHARCH